MPHSPISGFQDTILTSFETAEAAYIEPIVEAAKQEAVDGSMLDQVKQTVWLMISPGKQRQ